MAPLRAHLVHRTDAQILDDAAGEDVVDPNAPDAVRFQEWPRLRRGVDDRAVHDELDLFRADTQSELIHRPSVRVGTLHRRMLRVGLDVVRVRVVDSIDDHVHTGLPPP